ncbi:MAG: hypothetical protein K0S76_71 [Herbinix sp.]|nr:hypothetical protein [Herbinix sp.]
MKTCQKNLQSFGRYLPLLSLGLLLNSALVLTNRYMVRVPDVISILVSLTASILIIISMLQLAKEKMLVKEERYSENKE